MSKIFASASKIVFILMAVAAIVGFFLGRMDESNFMLLCGSAFTFYFSNKGSATPTNEGEEPYLGK